MLRRRITHRLLAGSDRLQREFSGYTTYSVVLALSFLFQPEIATASSADFSACWRFHQGAASGAHYENYDDSRWQAVRLPHTTRIEALVTGATGENSDQWQGLCWYRKEFVVNEDISDKVVWLKFEAAMGEADVWLNETLLVRHAGGYLPIVLDVSDKISSNEPNVLAVRLDNSDNGLTGPKPLAHLDFNFYGGLYREAQLIIKDRLHITDPILADKPASGGVFVTFSHADEKLAKLRVQTHVANKYDGSRTFVVRTSVVDAEGNQVAKLESDPTELEPNQDIALVQRLEINNPHLWSPDSPYLYSLQTKLLCAESVCDQCVTRVGARDIKITNDGLRLNGKKVFLRGTNRHQEYPYIGYALSANAQHRDARKIKDAGFDYVRLSHYPHSPAFLDACDELGLMVMDSILGWQYYSDLDEFKAFQYRQTRELVRQDRNHPCVLLWEASLNESPMTEEFTERLHAIAHQEYPGDQCFSCGWSGTYDVLIQARQHGGCKNIKASPCVVSEYGDWEYYAQNAGLSQDKWQDLSPRERTSRQDRSAGERRLLQQALNFQEAHNDNLKTTAFADGLWIMFDYNRGYSPDLETSGCMDIFRLSKPSYDFFQSQRELQVSSDGSYSGAVVSIANRWTSKSPRSVKVFSNCEEVALYLNDDFVARQGPDTDRFSTHLAHPPFTFAMPSFEPGKLRAIGYVDGEQVEVDEVQTPEVPVQLEVSIDYSGREVESAQNDVVFVHASVVDAHGILVANDAGAVTFTLEGKGEFIGANPARSRAGIATILYRAGSEAGSATIVAEADGLLQGEVTLAVIQSKKQGESECEIESGKIARSR